MIDEGSKLSCEDKRAYSSEVNEVEMYVDGRKSENSGTTSRNEYRSELYYVAIMDCNNNIQKVLGDLRNSKVDIRVGMTDDNLN